ncbi:MAG: SCP2 sterol-binding domain-containing protein [Thermoplasmatota archaeon]|nr:SCP2 sterol-binding domain-containing protein [Halobacteriales archaeon]
MPYLGPEWGRKALEALRSDPRVREAVQGISVSVLTRVTGAAGRRYDWLYASFDAGALADASMGHDGDEAFAKLPAATFTITGPYEVFAAIQRGELTEKRAVLSGRLHVRGNRLKAIRYMGPLETVTEVLAEIPCQT